jgi:acyl carrier protein
MTRSPNGPADVQKLTDVINEVLEFKGSPALGSWSDEHVLADAPLAFDSNDMAQLSTALEERFGRDPFTAGILPRTLGDLRRFFDKGA